jgi:hypothetical protein
LELAQPHDNFETKVLEASTHLANARDTSIKHTSEWRYVGIALLIIGLSCLLVRMFALDGAIGLLASLMSEDGQLGASRQAMLDTVLAEAGAGSLLFGALAFTYSTPAGRSRLADLLLNDPLRHANSTIPSGNRLLLVTTSLGLAIIALWWVRLLTPMKMEVLFAKEGPLELITFLALTVSAGLCIAAARRTLRARKTNTSRAVAAFYGLLGIGLFVVGMEEISWGQTYLQWQTPESWAAINSQQETTVHNLLEQPTLHVVERAILLLFVAAALIGIYLGVREMHPFITAIAPHFSTAPVLLLLGYAAYKFHLEVPEIIFAIFISCYSWRVYRSS